MARMIRRLALIAASVMVGAMGASASDASSRLPAPPRYRYMYDSESGQASAARHGWNLLDVGSLWAADRLPRGARGLVWVGNYDNSTCNWDVSDSELRSEIRAGDRKVAGYFISDEPDPYACPQAPAQHRARSRLIHSLDPGKFTVMVMDSNSGSDSLNQIPWWVGAADYVGLDPYPCDQGQPCQYSRITAIIRAADRARLRYWGVVQAFDDSDWRWPTPAEETHMLLQWASSSEAGYMTFAWTWDGHYLSRQTALLGVLTRFNRG